MKTIHRILIILCFTLFSLPAICQHFFDSAGHLLVTAKGKIYYDSNGHEIGRINSDYLTANYFVDASGVQVIDLIHNRLTFHYSYKHNPEVEYTSVYVKESGIYSYGAMIGYVDYSNKVYDNSGHELGYYDSEDEWDNKWGNPMLIYFLLLPNWGGRVP